MARFERVPGHWPTETRNALDVRNRRNGARVDLPEPLRMPPVTGTTVPQQPAAEPHESIERSLTPAEIGMKALANLATRAALNHAEAKARRERVRPQILRIIARYSGPRRGLSIYVFNNLSVEPPLTLRRVQEYVKEIQQENAESSVSR